MERYTAGQLAELAGVSSRTIRYYDQRGLLRPVEYSEGGYRLYDNDTLMKLQRILMLKFAGFSLEEIHGTMLMEENADIMDVLEDQRQLMIQKRDQIDEIIRLLEDIQEQKGQNPETMVEFMQLIKSVNHSGRTYRFIEQFGQRNLYPFEFSCLGLKENMRILDAGCGFGMIWRHSWERIPNNTEVTMLDIYSGSLDRFGEFYEENEYRLSAESCFLPVNEDVEQTDLEGTYDRIIFAYLFKYLKQPERTMNRLYEALKPGGFLLGVYGTGDILTDYDEIYHAFSGEYCLKARQEKSIADQKVFEAHLNQTFDRVEKISFDNELVFDRALDLYRFMMDSYKELVAEMKKQGVGFINFLRKYMEEAGVVKLHSRVMLYRCWKEEET